MSNQPEQFSDEAVRRFLLGSLTRAEQTPFEESLFADERLAVRVRLAEYELADDFAMGLLGKAEREQFQAKFLVTAERRQKLRVSEPLHARFASTSSMALPRPTIGERLQRLLGLNQAGWKLALSAVIIALLAGTVWVLWRKPQVRGQLITQGRKLIPRRRVLPAPKPDSNRQEAHHPNGSQPPVGGNSQPPNTAAGSPVVNIILLPESVYDRDKTNHVTLPEVDSLFHAQLVLERNRAGTFRIEILTMAGQAIFTEAKSTSADGTAAVDLNVPGRVLKPGDYQIKLMRTTHGIEEVAATYYLRVE